MSNFAVAMNPRARLARTGAGLALSALLAACGTLPAQRPADSLPRDGAAQACAEFLAAVDERVAALGVADAQAARIAGFPQLRIDRLRESFRAELEKPGRWAVWLADLRALDAEARAAELANLPAAEAESLRGRAPAVVAGKALPEQVDRCAERLLAADRDDPGVRELLPGRARVPDNYRTWQRVVGLYAVTAIPVGLTVRGWEAETREIHGQPPGALPLAGRAVAYLPPADPEPYARAEVARLLRRAAAADPLGIARPEPAELERLFATFAPVWVVDEVSGDDRLGRPYWPAEALRPEVDSDHPTVYRLLSYARFEGRALLQLNYVNWFPARPRTSALDILGGHLDGLTWRVTLGADGEPLLYDAIHNCGCYHLFFPNADLVARPAPQSLEEWALVPRRAPKTPSGGRRGLTLHLAHRTHQLVGLGVAAPGAAERRTYRYADYRELRSLAAGPRQRRSLFGPDGIIAGTDRGERYLLWPMGIPHPGAMRQWGNHATAFVGRRHFDDPLLIERLFRRSGHGAAR